MATYTYTRSNAWNNGGTFANMDLLWYARGVRAMHALPLDNLNSWWSFAALHGEYITEHPVLVSARRFGAGAVFLDLEVFLAKENQRGATND